MHFVNQRLKVLPESVRDVDEFSGLSPEKRVKVRDAFLDELDLIENFIDENPGDLTVDELEIIKSWHELVSGEFFVFRYLKKYTVFLASEKTPVAYGVLALTQPFEELVGPYLPVMTQTVLLPFNGKIIYDGLLSGYPVSFGPGIRRDLKENIRGGKKAARNRHLFAYRRNSSSQKADEQEKDQTTNSKSVPRPLANYLDGSMGSGFCGRRDRRILRIWSR